ncbi:OmpA family protein [Desulfospira joergensenii]|uniref:OmpA family protein n=1 Tax=Desulfospira joergensenii TaxID=53329 RepID=UPI0003B3500E|nr:OmpA family protein [Desulfospira joergensenii]
MKHRIIQGIVTVLVVIGLLAMVSCARKEVTTNTETVEQPPPPPVEEVAAAPEAIEPVPAQEVEKPEVREEEMEKARRAEDKERFFSRHILFAFDSAKLDDTAQALAREKAAWLDDTPNISVRIEGHCDQAGTEAYNMALGKRRAGAVKAYLESLGLPEDRLIDVSMGESDPISTDPGEAADRLNRRVEFKIQPPAQ